MKKKSSKQIITFLEKNIRYSYNAPSIYRKFEGKIPINTIRSELKRLYESGRIRKVSRGFYQALVKQENVDLLENPPTMLHAITIVAVSPKLQMLRQGLTSSNCKFETWMDFLEWLEREKFDINKYSKGEKKQYSKRIWYDDRDVRINIHSNSKINFFIGCSKHPLDYFEFRDIYNRTIGYLDCITPFTNEFVHQIGINKDFREFDLDGINAIRLRDFANAWWQIYRKETIQRVRFECHLNPKPVLKLGEAYSILESFSNPFIRNDNGHSKLRDEGGMYR